MEDLVRYMDRMIGDKENEDTKSLDKLHSGKKMDKGMLDMVRVNVGVVDLKKAGKEMCCLR